MNAANITKTIRHRRSIKPACLSDRPIDRSTLMEILDNANWAPTHGMTQPWRFRVFTGDSRQRLAEFLASTYRQVTDETTFKQRKYDAFLVNPLRASAVIAIGMKRQPSGKISELDELLAVGCAVQNMHLTAADLGLGGFWSTNLAATSDAMREFIGLQDSDRALGLFYLGYPAVDWPSGNRDPVESKVVWM